MLSRCLKQSLAQWIAKEKAKLVLLPGDTSVFEAALGTSAWNSDIEDIITDQASSFSLLGSTQQAVASEMLASNSVEYILSSVNAYQLDLVDTLSDLGNDFNAKLDVLRDVTQRTPDYNADKPALLQMADDLKFVDRALDNDETNLADEEALGELVEQGYITEEELDNYRTQIPIKRSKSPVRQIQVVNELRDRFYTIESSEADRILNVSPGQTFELVDEDGNVVEEVEGFDGGTLSTTGVITLTSNPAGLQQNASREIKIVPVAIQRKPNTLTPKTKRTQIKENVPLVEDELKFEVWACLILDIVDYFYDLWERLDSAVSEAILSTENMLGISNGIGLGRGLIGNEASTAVNRILQEINDIARPENLAGGLLGIQDTFRSDGLNLSSAGSGRYVCDFNHDIYCSIRGSLSDFLNRIFEEIDGLELSWGGINLDGLNIDLDGLVDALLAFWFKIKEEIDKLRDLIDKLRGDICAFVERRMRGVPKTVSAITAAIAGILLLLASGYPPLPTIDASSVITDAIARLTRAGYTEAAALLGRGDIPGFLSMDEEDAVPEGKVAACLFDAASRIANPDKSAAIIELALVATSAATQVVLGQQIREGMQRRYNSRSKLPAVLKIRAGIGDLL